METKQYDFQRVIAIGINLQISWKNHLDFNLFVSEFYQKNDSPPEQK